MPLLTSSNKLDTVYKVNSKQNNNKHENKVNKSQST